MTPEEMLNQIIEEILEAFENEALGRDDFAGLSPAGDCKRRYQNWLLRKVRQACDLQRSCAGRKGVES